MVVNTKQLRKQLERKMLAKAELDEANNLLAEYEKCNSTGRKKQILMRIVGLLNITADDIKVVDNFLEKQNGNE